MDNYLSVGPIYIGIELGANAHVFHSISVATANLSKT